MIAVEVLVMSQRVQQGGLQIAEVLYHLVTDEILPGTDIDGGYFWSELASIVNDLGPRNRELLVERDQFQARIDQWHKTYPGAAFDVAAYESFLREIAYLVPEGEPFNITTSGVDAEICSIAGPQLVVPVTNARFALNAANARWGSLFDALYGGDVIDEADGREALGLYNPVRGAAVISWAAEFLDQVAPLKTGSHLHVCEYRLVEVDGCMTLSAGGIDAAGDSWEMGLANPAQFVAYAKEGNQQSILLKNHGLHIELQIDRSHPVGQSSRSGVKDLILEAAVSTIQDCEDSVVAVDAEDKVTVYRHWLGLMNGTLTASFTKAGETQTRTLNADRYYTSVDGTVLQLHGRSLLLVRNVGHLMTTDAVLDHHGNEIPEGFLDAMITSLCAIHDLKGGSDLRNSRTGSIYIVKPKMHGPEEVAFTDHLFTRIESALQLAPHTLKVGVMDEERRTTVNLMECIRAVSQRVVFINTGFLDRTGDEIHTSMVAGPMLPKEAIKEQPWIAAYENQNVDVGLACGLKGKAQIGKGMWPKPDEMAEMMTAKLGHLQAGANCAWVPSPSAAVLHATHYHRVNVGRRQEELLTRSRTRLADILTPPLRADGHLSEAEIQAELDNNIQSILGYVVRWVDQGVGCSKVPDMDNVGLMEDRATLRISSQHIANWLQHNICTQAQVLNSLKRLAVVVDQQNAGDRAYRNMAPAFETNVAFQAACDLIFHGGAQPNGYTEPVLHARRREAKAKASM